MLKKEEKLKIKQECRTYLEEFERDPISGPNCFSAEELTLGIMFRVHPSLTHRATEEAIKEVMSNKAYPYYKREVLKIAEEKGWVGITALEQRNGFLPGNYKGTIKNNGLKKTGGYSSDDYMTALNKMDDYLRSLLDDLKSESSEMKRRGK